MQHTRSTDTQDLQTLEKEMGEGERERGKINYGGGIISLV